ncbi:acyl-CoA dehydrogenase family protein [Streptomyces jumonjinensis]|uniref:acyl-CoA dehydrogenase family protein n=1 Tax=Streptomyces jumonjinensis TaxID=1945 RepID=UPI0037B8CD51
MLPDALRDDLSRLVFDGRYEELHADLVEILHHEIFRYREGLTTAEQTALSYERLRFLNDALEPASEIVRRPLRLFALHEWPGLLDSTLAIPMTIHYNLCVGSILEHGAGRDDLTAELRELETMSSVGVFLATELGYGNNVAALRTEAVYDRHTREFVLHTPTAAAQKFMQNTGHPGVPKLAVVLARLLCDGTDHGVFPFLVRLRDADGPRPGVTITLLPEKPGLASDNAVTSFHHVRVPHRALLSGSAADFTEDGVLDSALHSHRQRFLHTMDRIQSGRLCGTTGLLAAARAALFLTVRYAHHRTTFAPGAEDVPLIAYRSHQRDLFVPLAQVYAMTFLVNRVKNRYRDRADGPGPDHELNRLLAVTKAVATWTAAETLEVCRERCGAQGMLRTNRIIDWITAAKAVITAEGDNKVLLLKAAHDMLSGRGYTPPGPGAAPRPGKRDLLDTGFLAELLAFREHRLHTAIIRSMAERLAEGASLFDAWNGRLNDALELARTHAGRLALEALAEAAAGARTEEGRAALLGLARIHGGELVGTADGWYLAEGALTAGQVLGRPALTDELCAGIAPYATALVDAFGIPATLLGSPLADAAYQDHYDYREPDGTAITAR